MSKWAEFYKGRTGDDYLWYVRERYKPFIDAIAHRYRPGERLLELGAGLGTISYLLNPRLFYPLMAALDNDGVMCARAMTRLKGIATVLWQDARLETEETYDVVHSHGLLEHFDDQAIRDTISAHSKARLQVHYVPGLYPAPTFGDERLMTVHEWQAICNPTQILTFNGGLDYALIFERPYDPTQSSPRGHAG